MQRLMRYEPAALWAMFVMMLIIATSTAISAQQAAMAAKNSDLIAQCTKPGTKCSDLQKVQNAKVTAQNKCVIDTIIHFPPTNDRLTKRDSILGYYDECVTDLTKAIANTPTTLSPVTTP